MRYRDWRLLRLLTTILLVLTVGVLSGISVIAKADLNTGLDIIPLSSRADAVSGGVVLVRINVPGQAAVSNLAVFLNGQAVTSAFQTEASGHSLLGLVEGLNVGKNNLTAKAIGQNNRPYLSANLTLTNYPIAGPIFSGPHEEPFYCMTQLFELPASTQTLGPALDANCSIATRVDYVYQATGGAFKPLPSLTVTQQTSSTPRRPWGKRFPISFAWKPERSTAGSTRRPSCMIRLPNRCRRPLILRQRGTIGWSTHWAVAVSVAGTSRAPASGMAESLKTSAAPRIRRRGLHPERLRQQLPGSAGGRKLRWRGRALSRISDSPAFTMGYGCSGGTEASHPIADEYPGLLDGLVMGCTFPEVTAAMVNNITDADLFDYYLTHRTTLTWSDAQIEAATGYPTVTTLARSARPTQSAQGPGRYVQLHHPENVQYDRRRTRPGSGVTSMITW